MRRQARRGPFLLGGFLLSWGLFSGLSGPAGAAEALAVLDLRAGIHDGDTRIVLDATAALPLTAEAIPTGAAIPLPPIDWKAPPLAGPVGNLTGYEFEDRGPDGAVLVFATRQPVTILHQFMIPPGGESTHYRLVLDLHPMPPPPVAKAPPPPPKVAAASPPAPKPVDVKPPPNPQPADTQPVGPTLPALPLDQRPVVMLDPGHGGIDPGTIGVSGTYEKTVVLALAQQLKATLERDQRVTVYLTREADTYLTLTDRVAVARLHHADLFVSLHANANRIAAIHGFSVYTLSQTASDTETQSLADAENKSDAIAGIDLAAQPPEVGNILIELATRETMGRSAQFAALLLNQTTHDLKGLPISPRKSAGFAVLKALDMPSALVETGYLTNPAEEKALRTPEYRQKLADALAHAIEGYFQAVRKPGMTQVGVK